MEWVLSHLLDRLYILRREQADHIDDLDGGKKTLIDELDMVELPYLHCVVNETHTPPTRSAAPHTSHIRIPRGTILFAKKLNPKRFKGYRGGKMS